MRIEDSKIFVETFGCKLNYSESSTIRRMFESRGAAIVADLTEADIIIINSCSVTGVAEKKIRQSIRHIHKSNPSSKIVVVGCYAQLRPQELISMEGVVLVAGTAEKMNILERLENMPDNGKNVLVGDVFNCKRCDSAFSYGDRTRSFLKIQDGCNYFCTYCTIPYARGTSRSLKISQVVDQVRKLSEKGVKEVILTGVNIGDFGTRNGESLLELVKVLDGLECVDRYRISSIEPNLLTDEIIRFTAESKHFMPHFHIPLQSGSDKVLELMHRRYDSSFFAKKVALIRTLIPDAFIGVDVIVGMRGESAEEFKKSESFISGLDISRLHVFPYSERSGTRALKIPGVVSQEEKHSRVERLLKISDEKFMAFNRRFVGTVRPVLFEGKRSGKEGGEDRIEGFTDNYIRVSQVWNNNLLNKIMSVELNHESLVFNYET